MACGGLRWVAVGRGGGGWILVDPVVVGGGLQGLFFLKQ